MQKPIRGREYIKRKLKSLELERFQLFYFCAKKERIFKILSCKLRIYIKFDIYLQIF